MKRMGKQEKWKQEKLKEEEKEMPPVKHFKK